MSLTSLKFAVNGTWPFLIIVSLFFFFFNLAAGFCCHLADQNFSNCPLGEPVISFHGQLDWVWGAVVIG